MEMGMQISCVRLHFEYQHRPLWCGAVTTNHSAPLTPAPGSWPISELHSTSYHLITPCHSFFIHSHYAIMKVFTVLAKKWPYFFGHSESTILPPTIFFYTLLLGLHYSSESKRLGQYWGSGVGCMPPIFQIRPKVGEFLCYNYVTVGKLL